MQLTSIRAKTNPAHNVLISNKSILAAQYLGMGLSCGPALGRNWSVLLCRPPRGQGY